MKFEIIARNSQMCMIQRYINGTRFYSVTPEQYRTMIFANIKKAFKNKPVKIDISKNWLRIEKTKSEELEKELREKTDVEALSEEEMLQKEVEILRKSGFFVTYKIIEE